MVHRMIDTNVFPWILECSILYILVRVALNLLKGCECGPTYSDGRCGDLSAAVYINCKPACKECKAFMYVKFYISYIIIIIAAIPSCRSTCKVFVPTRHYPI